MQAELQKLLYPTFILCYLRLVKHGASAEAQQMLAKHRARFVGTAQRPAQARLQVSAPANTSTLCMLASQWKLFYAHLHISSGTLFQLPSFPYMHSGGCLLFDILGPSFSSTESEGSPLHVNPQCGVGCVRGE